MGALVGCIVIAFVLLFVVDAIHKAAGASAYQADARYWRKAYETLVAQTGRDLNDGLGIDPRSRKAASQPPEPQEQPR